MPTPSTAELLSDRKHFLSAANPLATTDQRDAEALAIRIYETAQVQRVKHEVAAQWLNKPRVLSVEALSTFDAGVADFTFICALNAAISDPNNPKVLLAQCEPHRWFGMDVPGSRRGGNNADNAYRHVTVDGTGHYEIIGKRFANPPPDVTFTLIGNTSMSKTLGGLEFRDMEIGSDGLFKITLDPSPANGRKNHIQTTPEAKYVFVRDSMTDWKQLPNALRIRRLDPTGAPPVSFDEMVARAVKFAQDDAEYYSKVIDITLPFPNNSMAAPFNAGKFGGLVSQAGSVGYFDISDDEALLVNFTLAGAPYVSFHSHDPWWRTITFARHTSSLNNAQVVPDPDGAITLVLSVKDPGVHNWIDTAGLHEGIISFRWQALPRNQPESEGPQIRKVEKVLLRELPGLLPKGTKMVSSQERAAQISARAAAYAARWLES